MAGASATFGVWQSIAVASATFSPFSVCILSWSVTKTTTKRGNSLRFQTITSCRLKDTCNLQLLVDFNEIVMDELFYLQHELLQDVSARNIQARLLLRSSHHDMRNINLYVRSKLRSRPWWPWLLISIAKPCMPGISDILSLCNV